MVEVNHNKNIQRIVDVIKSDSNLFDDGQTKGKLRSVEFGDPPNVEKKHFAMPYAYVTTRDTIQVTSYPFGISTADNISQVSVQYEIAVVAHKRDNTVNSQKQLYEITKNLRNLIESNPTFLHPTDANDPIFSRSVLNEVPWDRDTKGQLVTIIKFVLLATIGESSSMDIPGIGEIPLLSIPTNEEGEEWDADRIQDGTRVITGKGDFGNIYLQYESNPALDTQIRAKFDTEETITITTNGIDRSVNVYYADRNLTSPFDGISRAVLHLEIVQP